jgi:hypothetical protein
VAGSALKCRRWLAGDGGLKPCGDQDDAFASKPAPTDRKKRPTRNADQPFFISSNQTSRRYHALSE